MIYLGNPSTAPIRAAMAAGRIGCLLNPGTGSGAPPGATWAADNAKFGKSWPGHDRWWKWLTRMRHEHDPALCLFAVAPDVVGDAAATLAESRPWLARIRELGLPVAFVAQDGCSEPGLIPWGELDVLFLGGSDRFKLGAEARVVAAAARGVEVPVHMGRVNSRRRLRYAEALGCSSADGTYLTFGPDLNLGRLSRWMAESERSIALWEA